MKKIALVITCEHAVYTVPELYAPLFVSYQNLLATHRGIDFGASAIAQAIHAAIPSDLIEAKATRLLIDCNKSLHNPDCFSEATRHLAATEKQNIYNLYYLPYREEVKKTINQHIEQGMQVWHFSIHSFTPVMNDIIRDADIGLLYDPQRLTESKLAELWKKTISTITGQYRIKMNYPYKGTDDGFTTDLRTCYNDKEYIGIELETNQALTQNASMLALLKNHITASISKLL